MAGRSRVLAVALIALCAWLAFAAASPGEASALSRKQAASKAIKALKVRNHSRAVIVFGLTKPVRAGTRITEAGTRRAGAGSRKSVSSRLRAAGVRSFPAASLGTIRGERFFVFYEDRGPFQLYQHPGRVVLVGQRSGKVLVSRTITWPPLVNGKLPAFLRSASGYRSSKYRVFYRPWATSSPNPRRSAPGAKRNLFEDDPFGPGRPLPGLANAQRIADRLAAERSCVLRVSDTMQSAFDAASVATTRTYVGTLFAKLEQLNPGFIDERYGARQGESPVEAVDDLVSRGCRDVLLYVAGYAWQGEDTLTIGMGLSRGALLRQELSEEQLEALVNRYAAGNAAGRPTVTFKLKVDAPWAGGLVDSLSDLQNVLLVETASDENQPGWAWIPEVQGPDGMVPGDGNPGGLLEFSNRELQGLHAFFDSQEEIEAGEGEQARGGSFLAFMLARALELGDPGFGPDMGSSPQMFKRPPPGEACEGRPPERPPPCNEPPDAQDQSVSTAEDTPVNITLGASDPDGDALTFTTGPGPSNGVLSGSGNTRTYTPNDDYNGPDSFQFTVDDGHGGTDTATVTINVTASNDPPVVTTSSGTTGPYTENAAGIVVDNALTVSDVDDTQLNSASVRIDSASFQAGDELEFTNQLGIEGFYDHGTGLLTLSTPSGEASVSDWQTALRDVKFRTDADNPSTPKTINFVANDGDEDSAPASKNVSITGVNDAPGVDVNDTNLAYTENDGPVPIDDAMVVFDPDSPNLQSATVTVSNWIGSEDQLSFPDSNTGDGITLGSYDDTTGTLTLTGSSSPANYQAALQEITYENGSDNPDETTRTASFTVNDGALDSNTDTRGIQVTRVNDTPTTTTSGGSNSYTEGDSPTDVDNALTVTDPDSANLTGATISITTGFESGDTLSFVDTANITGTYDTGTGVLTLTGTDTVANYQAALRSVEYSHAGDNPATSKVVSFSSRDAGGFGNTATKSLSITRVNDAPTINTTSGALSYTESSGAQPIDTGLTVSDPDSTQIQGATVQITSNFTSAEDDLTFTSQLGITGSYDDSTGTLTLSGTTTVANYQTALRDVRYQNTSDNPSNATRTVSFQATDAEGAASAVATRDINVAPADDPPTTTTSGGSNSYTEGDSPTDVDNALTVTDPDSANLTGATISITTGFESGDTLSFVDTANITGTYDTGTGVLTLTGTDTVANYQAALRSVEYSHTGDNPATSKVVSFSSRDAGGFGNTATKSLSITRVNDAPTINTTGSALSYTEGDGAVAVDNGLTVTDPDSTQIQGATVQITSNFTSAEDDLTFTTQLGITGSYDDSTGTLTLSGTASVSDYQTALRDVRYQNTSDNPSSSTRTVTFQATDAEGATSSGATRDINLTGANDAPVTTTSAGSTSYTEGDSPTDVDNALTVSDADDTNLESAQVSITSGFESGDTLSFVDTANITGNYNTGTGVLTLTGTDTVANYQLALRSVEFSTTHDNPATSKTVSFKVNDGDVDSNTATKGLSITRVNDAPTTTTSGGDLAYTENDGPEVIDNTVAVSDPDSSQLAGATVSITGNFSSAQDELAFADQLGITGSYNDSTGVLTLTGTDTVANYQIALRTVTYENVSDGPTPLSRTITFQATDAEGAASNSATKGIAITAVNDPPTAVNDTGTTDEDTTLNVAAPGVLGNDTDPDAVDTKTVTKLNGSTTLTGTATDGAAVTINADGSYSYNPGSIHQGLSTGQQAQATFTYTMQDSGGQESTATVTITINGVSDAPTANDDQSNTNGNTALYFGTTKPATQAGRVVSGSVLTNDTDPDTPSGSLSATPATGQATLLGGTVDIESDGNFTYTPPTSTEVMTDTFTYTVSDGVQSDSGTVSIPLAQRVWYVRNDATPGGTGRSTDPFDTIGEAESASNQDDTVYVFEGNGTTLGYTSGYTMQNSGERLIGEASNLTADPDDGGGLGQETYFTGNSSNRPTLTDLSADVVELNASALVRGIDADPSGAGSGGIAGAAGDTNTTIDNVTVIDGLTGGGDPGIELDSTGAGTHNISEISVSTQANAALRLNSASTVNVAATGLTSLTSSTGRALDAINTTMNATFDSVSSTASTNAAVNLSGTTGTTNFGDVNVTATNSPLATFRASSAGTVNLPAANSIVVNGSGGAAVDLASSAMNATFDTVSVTNSPSGGVSLSNNTGSTTFGSSFGVQTISGAAAGLFAASPGTLTVNGPGTANISTTGGPAVDVNSASGATLQFGDVTSASSATDGINLDGLGGGSFSATAGSITGAGDRSFDLNGGTGSVTYPGDLNNGSGTTAVDITGRGAGSTTSLSGNINDTNDSGGTINIGGAGILGNTGGTTTLSGGTKQANTGGSNGVDLDNNNGHTVTFSNGGLDIDTTAGRGLEATNNGTLAITGSSNTINTGTGRGIHVDGVTLSGAATFQSVSTGATDVGIDLNNTGSSGNLLIQGDGDASADAGGGTLNAPTSDGIQLDATNNADIRDMNITNPGRHGINAGDTATINNLDVDNTNISGAGDAAQEHGISLEQVTGTVDITGPGLISDSSDDQVRANPSTGTRTITIDDVDFNGDYPNGAHGVSIVPTGGNTTTNVRNGLFDDHDGSAVQVIGTSSPNTSATNTTTEIENNQIEDNAAHGADIGAPITGSTTFNIHDNTFLRVGQPEPNDLDSAVHYVSTGANFANSSLPAVNGAIDNNTIGTAATIDSGTIRGKGIFLEARSDYDGRIQILNNTMHHIEWRGVDVVASLDGGAGQPGCTGCFTDSDSLRGVLDLTIRGNNIASIDNDDVARTGVDAMQFDLQDTYDFCLDLGHPSDAAQKNTAPSGVGTSGLGFSYQVLAQLLSTATFPGYAGGANSNTDVEAYIAARNIGTGANVADAQNDGQANAFGGGTCNTPSGLP